LARTLLDLATVLSTDIDESRAKAPTIIKLKSFINRSYKEVAKRQRLEKSVSVTATNGQITKPSDFYIVVKIEYDGELIPYEEEADYISVPYDGSMALYYRYIPVDLTDADEPKTNIGNDQAIINYARYLFFQSEGMGDEAETALRDFETSKIKTTKKKLNFIVVR
jgi:hypothetical protein